MATEVKRLIKVRVSKGARFKRDGYGKKRQLSDSWRKPRGQHNKQREQKKAKGAHPKPGFGSPVAVRGMHPSGFFEVIATTAKDLEGLDPKTQAVRIAATVGNRKRTALQDAAQAKGLKVLNARVVKAKAAKAPAKKSDTKESGKTAEKKPAGKKAPAKKAAAKPKAESAEKTEKKAPAKKAAAKPKAESAEKTEKKTPAKKAAAKPKAESADAKPKAEKKPAAKKTTKSGVKKNE